MTKASILELREKIQAVRSGQDTANSALGDKESVLAEKEQMLSVRALPHLLPCTLMQTLLADTVPRAHQITHTHTHTANVTHIPLAHHFFQDLHVQLRSKNDMMKAMKRQIKKLNGTLPKMLEEQPDDDDWAW